MDQLDREVIESLSEPAKRVFGSLDYRSRQRMLKKAKAMAKEEKTRNQKKSRVKKKGIEKQNKAKRKKKGSSSKSERVLFSIYETKDLMVQSMHLMLLGSSVADNAYEERDFAHTDEPQVALSRETVQKSSRVAMGGIPYKIKHRCVHIMRILQGLNERGKRHILCAKIKQIKLRKHYVWTNCPDKKRQKKIKIAFRQIVQT